MFPDWQRRRSAFNHDWLKNRFLTALASFINILDDLVEDPEAEKRFVQKTLPQWSARTLEASRLIDDFESEMSPRALFQQPPLSRCGSATRRWLPDLAHQLWRHRVNAGAMCADAREALVKANEAYEQVVGSVGSCADPSEAQALRPFRDRFEVLLAACEQFSKSISRFPGRIEVV
jgi:hypothetical protein